MEVAESGPCSAAFPSCDPIRVGPAEIKLSKLRSQDQVLLQGDLELPQIS